MSDPNLPSQDHASYQRELDKMRAEALYRSATERAKYVADFAMLGLRSLTVVNGGAIIAILTFLGHNEQMAVRPALWAGFGWLIAGLALSLVAILFAYISQHLFSHQDHHGADKIFFLARGDSTQVTVSETNEDKAERKGSWLQVGAIASAAGSFGCFAYGAVLSLTGLAQASVNPLM